jgi:hypothetical protein
MGLLALRMFHSTEEGYWFWWTTLKNIYAVKVLPQN